MLGFLTLQPFLGFAAYGWDPYTVDLQHPPPFKYDEARDHLEPVEHTDKSPYFLVKFEVHGNGRTFFLISGSNSAFNLFKWEEIETSDKKVREVSVPIPDDIVNVVYQLWINALLEVRYDPLGTTGDDGTTFYFAATLPPSNFDDGKILEGKTWSPPRERPPAWMIEAGDAVLQYAKDGDADACRQKLKELHDKLFAYWKKNGRS